MMKKVGDDMKLGARIFKTALAVVLSLYISEWFHLNAGFLAAIAAVLAIKPSIHGSFKHMKEQIYSNVLGAFFAFIGLFLLGDEPFVIGLVIMLVIIILVHFKAYNSTSIAVVTVIAIMSVGEAGEFIFAVNRLLAIISGILCALLVNILFLPPKYEKKLLSTMKNTHSKMSFLLKNVANNGVEKTVYVKEVETIASNVKSTKELYQLFFQEYQSRLRKPTYSELRQLVVMKNLQECIFLEHRVLQSTNRHMKIFQETNEPLLDEITKKIQLSIDYQEQLFFKYEKKLKTDYTFEENTEAEQHNRMLLLEIVKQFKQNDSSIYLFPIISAIIEWYDQLEKTERLINNYHTHHQKKE